MPYAPYRCTRAVLIVVPCAVGTYYGGVTLQILVDGNSFTVTRNGAVVQQFDHAINYPVYLVAAVHDENPAAFYDMHYIYR